jgi:hypothetical protein
MNAGLRLAAFSVLVLLTGGLAWGAPENERESLRGLTAVSVRIETLSDSARRNGLDEQAIRTDVEQKLRQAGIQVLTSGQITAEPGSPVLYIHINARALWGNPNYAVNTIVALLQGVVAVRNDSLRLREVKTWDVGYLTNLSRANLPQVRNTVSDLVDEFIKDWQAVNPKK